MRVTPISRYDNPRMPTHAILDEHPELLRLVPRRWQYNRVVLVALAGGCVFWSGCSTRTAQVPRATAGAVLPPHAMLCEDEARRIIVQEARAHGLVFRPDARAVRVDVPGRSGRRGAVSVTITLDGVDQGRKVAYEYVSDADCHQELAPIIRNAVSTTALQDSLNRAGEGLTIGVLRDPHARTDAENREQFRAQLRDFIKWLRAQGVI